MNEPKGPMAEADAARLAASDSVQEAPRAKRFTYAIGDVHGRLDLLERAADAITAHIEANDALGRVIFLGDYVDRGPDSKGVVEFLMQAHDTGAITCLRGNHETMMVLACRHNTLRDMWIANGGNTTLDSYGGWEGVPAAHLDWMAALPLTDEDDLRVFVHAGLLAGVPVDKQDEEVCLWIRDRFLQGPAYGKHVVHGHTHTWAHKRTADPELLDWRTNLDTAAFYTGILTVAVFSETQAQPIEIISINMPPHVAQTASASSLGLNSTNPKSEGQDDG